MYATKLDANRADRYLAFDGGSEVDNNVLVACVWGNSDDVPRRTCVESHSNALGKVRIIENAMLANPNLIAVVRANILICNTPPIARFGRLTTPPTRLPVVQVATSSEPLGRREIHHYIAGTPDQLARMVGSAPIQ